jgi:hypothetical protein
MARCRVFRYRRELVGTQKGYPQWTPNGKSENRLKDFVKFALEYMPPKAIRRRHFET